MKILVVDDEQSVRDALKRYLSLEGFETACADNGFSAQRLLEQEAFSAAVVDLKMPGMTGLELLDWIKTAGIRLPVIMISAFGEVPDAVEAMKKGAHDYLVKPFDSGELVLRLSRAVEDQILKDSFETGKRSSAENHQLIGETPGMREIKKVIAQVAPAPSTVLITGESGCGKEVVARSIHAASAVGAGPFVAINLGGLPESLAESELFGYEKGAFTGAINRKPGLFELASHGTLFLDEIGEMSLALQVKLLRVLQDKRILRLGATQTVPINARVIAATNRPLEQAVKDGSFREDLFFRLNVIRIDVPPLRDRLEDIPLLAGHCMERLNRTLGKTIRAFTPAALRKLQTYRFPGNVRELENLLERAFIFTREEEIRPEDINLPGEPGPTPSAPSSLEAVELRTITEALRRWEGNRTRAARELGVSRRTIINKIKEYGIDIPPKGADREAAGHEEG